MSYEVSIEVTDGEFSARLWYDLVGDSMIETALLYGATDWRHVERDWGVVVELEFDDAGQWLACRANPSFDAALEQAPDPVAGVHIHPGWGGASGVRVPRDPRPVVGAGALELPVEPDDVERVLASIVIARPCDDEFVESGSVTTRA